MGRKRKKNKKKILIIVLIIIFILFLLGAYLIYTKTNIFTYKSKITIEVGEKVPSIKDYLYKDSDKVKEIVWNDIEEVDNKIYIPGT